MQIRCPGLLQLQKGWLILRSPYSPKGVLPNPCHLPRKQPTATPQPAGRQEHIPRHDLCRSIGKGGQEAAVGVSEAASTLNPVSSQGKRDNTWSFNGLPPFVTYLQPLVEQLANVEPQRLASHKWLNKYYMTTTVVLCLECHCVFRPRSVLLRAPVLQQSSSSVSHRLGQSAKVDDIL